MQTTSWIATVASLTAGLAGCATTSGLDPKESRSGFDGARIVQISPHGATCPNIPCVSLGAHWSSANPEGALLIVRISGTTYSGIRRVEFNIDGTITAHEAKGSLTRFSPGTGLRESEQTFGTRLEVIRRIAEARRAWVRVYTNDGYIEDAIIDGEKDSKALHALRRFLAQQGSTGPAKPS